MEWHFHAACHGRSLADAHAGHIHKLFNDQRQKLSAQQRRDPTIGVVHVPADNKSITDVIASLKWTTVHSFDSIWREEKRPEHKSLSLGISKHQCISSVV
jgi:hypothetical protein